MLGHFCKKEGYLPVDDRGFTDVGITNQTNGNSVLDVVVSGIVLDQLDDVVRTQSLAALKEFFDQVFFVVKGVAEDVVG